MLRGFSAVIFDSPDIREDLQIICSWHDRITSLPDLDPTWTYQLEFGITPPCLFQVRPFKPRQKANFKLEKQKVSDVEPIVIGFTPPEGLILKVVDYDSEVINDDCVFVDTLHGAYRAANFPNLRANLFYFSNGFLQHHDIQAIRKAQVTGLFMSHPLFLDLKPGDFVNLQADGKNIKVTKIDHPQ